MAAVEIREDLWHELAVVAKRQKKTPAAVARQALRDYIRRVNDTELLEQSTAAARRTKFPLRDSEKIVREFRRARRGE